MSGKGGKKKTIKNNKKTTKDKKSATLKLDDGETVLAKSICKETTRVFNISDIDIDKIRVSDKTFTSKIMIHISIMCFMNMIMNTFLGKLLFWMYQVSIIFIMIMAKQ